MLHDSLRTTAFWGQISRRNSSGVTPNGDTKCRWWEWILALR